MSAVRPSNTEFGGDSSLVGVRTGIDRRDVYPMRDGRCERCEIAVAAREALATAAFWPVDRRARIRREVTKTTLLECLLAVRTYVFLSR